MVHTGRHSLGIVDMRFAWASLEQPSWVGASSFLVVGNKMLGNVVHIERHNLGIVGMHQPLEQPSLVVASSWLVAVDNMRLDNVVHTGQRSLGIVGMHQPLA